MKIKAKFNLDKMGFVFDEEAKIHLEVKGVPIVESFKENRKPVGYVTESKFEGNEWIIEAIVDNNTLQDQGGPNISELYPAVNVQAQEIKDKKILVKKFKLIELSLVKR
jgi:hypothetical protein